MRIKRGVTKNARHNKVLKLTKGFRLSYGTLYRRSIEALLHAGQYSFAHRRHRRSQLKQGWISTISAALKTQDISYSKFVHQLDQKNIELNSKMLAVIAANYPEHFSEVVKTVK